MFLPEVYFTLIFWVMLGQRFEEMRLGHLSARQCGVYQEEMLRERSPVRADCVPDPPRKPYEYKKIYHQCAPCGGPIEPKMERDPVGGFGPLPGRRRV